MSFLLNSPSLDDLVRLLRAWRFWMFGAILGALLGAAVYVAAPPPYRAKATVNVDFNLEQAWPQDVDRQQFYYLERESRKLEELAWSDDVLEDVSSQTNVSVADMRAGKLQLSQPAEAGWHFYADDPSAEAANALASAWAQAFADKVQSEISAGNVNEFVKLEVTQAENLPKERSVPLSGYLLAGSMALLVVSVFGLLFIKPR